MSSGSEYGEAGADDSESAPSSRPVSRLRAHSPPSSLPRKRRRLGSIDPSRTRKYDVEGRYNDGYRVLVNQETSRAASRFEVDDSVQHYSNQVGTSQWSSTEQAALFAALERLGRHDSAAISRAIGTKSEPEVRDFLLLLQDAASKHGHVKLTLRDIPAAIEIGQDCEQRLDEAGDALAWYQERFEATQEQQRYGDYWLITPQIADTIEHAIDPITRPSSPSTPQVAEFERTGPGIAGACTQCRKRKIKCNRARPCNSCVRSKADCIYPDSVRTIPKQRIDMSNDESTDSDTPMPSSSLDPGAHVLRSIPEANLLKPQAMLTLSRTLFMNRSPDIPSPWLHWSKYTTQLAAEPSMYRTAFNDFHSLVISVTRRLVLAAMAQATSRLRTQRFRRSTKGTSPFVKRRDVFAALDVLGFERNGRDYWKGVPRRCGLQVYTTKISSKGRLKRKLKWDDVEQMLSLTLPLHQPLTFGVESLDEPPDVMSRAIRCGTPHSIQNLALSSPEHDSQDHSGSDDGFVSSADDYASDNMLRPPASSQARDPFGRYASVPPIVGEEDHPHHPLTLEAFDQEASREEERVLWDMLGLKPPSKHDSSTHNKSNEIACGEFSEKLATNYEDWSRRMAYQSEWEEFTTFLNPTAPQMKRAPQSFTPGGHDMQYRSTDALSDVSSVGSSASESGRHGFSMHAKAELRTHGTMAYAALQTQEVGHSQDQETDGTSELELSVPTKSVEMDPSAAELGEWSDGMDME